MIRDHLTIEKTIAELHFLKGCILADCFTQEKNVVMLQFDDLDSEEEHYLQFNNDMKHGGIFLRSGFNKAKSNTFSFFEDIYGLELKGIDLHPFDRIIFFDLGKAKLSLHVFGGNKSNIFLLDNDLHIIDCYKDAEENKGKSYSPDIFEPEEPENISEDSNVRDIFTKSTIKLSSHYAKILLHEFGIDPKTDLSEISNRDELISAGWELRMDLIKAEKSYMIETQRGYDITFMKPDEFDSEYDSVNRALESQFRLQAISDSFAPLYKETAKEVRSKFKKAEKAIKALGNLDDSDDKSDKYHKWAEILKYDGRSKQRFGKEIELYDWEGNQLAIPLDPKLTLQENSEKYFEKAKKQKEDLEIRKQRLPKLKKELELIENAKNELEKVKYLKELQKFREKYSKHFRFKMQEEFVQKSPEEKYRTFDLGEGFMLYVGKNAKNNDELTMRFAKANDIWLHARGSGGSHCVLRMPGKTEKPPKLILQKAAQISAYYSQARNAKYTPVSWTYKKYVRKPKGANIGQVTISREEVIMVEPKLD